MTTAPAPGTVTASYTVDRYVEDVGRLLDAKPALEDTVRRIAELNRRFVTGGAGLPAALTRVHPTAPYTRNLVHADPKGRFTVIAIVWGPFQETAVHDHVNWCVVGVVRGTAHVTNYERLDDESVPGKAELRVCSSGMAPAGTVTALLPPPRSNIHKMANASREAAISLHTYGDPGDRAKAFDIRAGAYSLVDLKFHNLEP